MNVKEDLLMDISILYRSTQKYYDRKLEAYHITYAQLPILLFIFEQEGITMQQIGEKGSYDKGTVTKNVKKLETLGYVKVVPSEADKRVRHIYTTYKAKQIISRIYRIRTDWWDHISKDLDEKTLETFEKAYTGMCEKANEYAHLDPKELRFYDWIKLSLSHYPDLPCTILKVGGCNLRCPGCRKKNLVFLGEGQKTYEEEDVMFDLRKNKGRLHAVSIEGGEPGLHPELGPFLKELKTLGYHVKINTNGMYPDVIGSWIVQELVDWIEIDLKSVPEHYAQVTGIYDIDTNQLLKTIRIVKESGLPHRFATTLIRSFHDEHILNAMIPYTGSAPWILRNYQECEQSIEKGLEGFSECELQEIAARLKSRKTNIKIEKDANHV